MDDPLAGVKNRAWREMAEIDRALESGEIDDDGWHERVRQVVEPAYLASPTPQGQSGHSGDAKGWDAARRLLVDAVDRDGTFLDVGCANGLLMETIVDWAGAAGHLVAPYGLEISAALAGLARRRCPQWAERIWEGNGATFRPSRRFTFVRTGLEYVPRHGRRGLVAHLLDEVVEPGGRLIVGVYNEEIRLDTTATEVESWGFGIGGRTARTHRHPEIAYKAFWVDRAPS